MEGGRDGTTLLKGKKGEGKGKGRRQAWIVGMWNKE
jgi:hypothetical protein